MTCESLTKDVSSRAQGDFQQLLALYNSARSRREKGKIRRKAKTHSLV